MLINSTFDIFAVNESKIDDTIADAEISIPGYNLTRSDRNRAGGGVVIYVRDTIPFYERVDLVPDSLEMICIEIFRPFNKSFLVSTWYRPPNSSLNLFKDFEAFVQNC